MKKKIKKSKAYNYKTFNEARIRGYSYKQWKTSITAKQRWDNLSPLIKEIILENLEKWRKIFKFKKKNYIEVYEIVSQSHYDARGTTPSGNKYHTLFEYTTKGYFDKQPSLDKIEVMIKNSLIGAFNSGKKNSKGKFLKNSVFSTLVDNHIRGIKINKIKIHKDEINNLNNINAELNIINNKKKWIGKN